MGKKHYPVIDPGEMVDEVADMHDDTEEVSVAEMEALDRKREEMDNLVGLMDDAAAQG